MKGLAIATLIAFCGLLAVARGQSIVEVYIAVDNKVKEYYRTSGIPTSNIKKDVEYFMKEVNDIYKKTNLGLELRVGKIDVLSRDIFTNIQIQNAVYGEQELQNWNNYLNKGSSFSNYDVGMLLTGYDLVGNDGSRAMVGIANVRSICLKSAVTLVEFKGLGASAMVAAHEIGHILGLEHDDTHTSCPDGYIMSSIHRVSEKSKFDFSRCSVTELRKLISGKNCLSLQQTTSSAISDSVRPSPEYYDADTMCKKQMNNKDGILCQGASLYNNRSPQGDTICQAIYCGLPGSSTCSLHDSSNLLVCDPGKRCYRGRCQTAPSDLPVSPAVKHDCIFGDAPSINVNTASGTVRMTCPNYVANNRGQCSSSYVKSSCCASCGSGNAGTGTVTTRPSNTQRPGSCGNGYVKNINTNNCESCQGDYPNLTVNGQRSSCSQLVSIDPRNCNQAMVKQACCATCANTRIGSTNTRCVGSDDPMCTQVTRNTACSQFPKSCCNLCSNTQVDKRDIPDEGTIVMDTAIDGDFRVDY